MTGNGYQPHGIGFNTRRCRFPTLKFTGIISARRSRLGQIRFDRDVAPSQNELAARIAALQDRQDRHKELLGELDEKQKQISVTDPDKRKLPTAHGMIVGCNAQAAVDAHRGGRRDQRGH